MRAFFRGLAYPFRGLGFAFEHPDVLRWFAAPLLLGIALIVGEYYALSWAIHHYLADASWWKVILAWISGLTAMVLLFVSLQGLLCIPFCDTIAKRTEAHVLGTAPPSAPLTTLLISFGHALVRIVVYLIVLLALFIIGLFVPFMTIPCVLWTAAYVALDSFDYPTTRRRWTFGQKLALLRQHTGASLGFGVAAWLFALVPVLNLVVAPSAAVGGTLLFLDLQRTKR
jgi:CysZ protein